MNNIERTFTATDRHGAEIQFELITPGLREEHEGERQYRIAYSQALKEGIFPREKLREIMKGHGMWTDEDQKVLKRCVATIAVSQVELKTAQATGDDDICIKLARIISDTRARMWELFLVQQTVYMHSAEGVAETVKMESMMSACVRLKSTGTRYWPNYGDFILERDDNIKADVATTAMVLHARILDELRQGLMDEYPEKQYLKSAEERIIDREVEEEVVNILRTRAETAIDVLDAEEALVAKKKLVKKKVTRKKPTRRKKKASGK